MCTDHIFRHGNEVSVGTNPTDYAQKLADLYTNENLWNKYRKNMLRWIKLNLNDNRLLISMNNLLERRHEKLKAKKQ